MATTSLGASGVTFPDNSVQASAARSGGGSSSSGTDVTLTSASAQTQLITMTASGLSVILPNATTLGKGSVVFEITASFTSFYFYIKNASGNLVTGPIYPGQTVRLSLEDNSTSNGVWTQVTGVTPKGAYDALSVSSAAYYLNGGFQILPMSATSCIVLHWGANGANTIVTAVGVTLSGTTFSFGTPVTLYNSAASTVNQVSGCSLSSTAAVVTVALDIASITIWSLTLSGNTVTNAGSAYLANNSTYYSNLYAVPYAISSTEVVAWIAYFTAQTNYTYSTLLPLTVSGATITLGTAANITAEFGQYAGPKARLVKTGTGTIVVASNNGSNSTQRVQAYTLASNVLTAGTAVTIPATNQSSIGNYSDACYSPAANVAIFLNGGWSLRVTNSSTTISSWSETPIGPTESVSVISGGQVLVSPYTIGYGNSSGFQGASSAIGGNLLMSIGKAAMLDSTTGVAIGRYSSSGTNYLAAQLLKVI